MEYSARAIFSKRGIHRTICCSLSDKVLDVSKSKMEKENPLRQINSVQEYTYVLVMWFSVLGAGVVVVVVVVVVLLFFALTV